MSNLLDRILKSFNEKEFPKVTRRLILEFKEEVKKESADEFEPYDKAAAAGNAFLSGLQKYCLDNPIFHGTDHIAAKAILKSELALFAEDLMSLDRTKYDSNFETTVRNILDHSVELETQLSIQNSDHGANVLMHLYGKPFVLASLARSEKEVLVLSGQPFCTPLSEFKKLCKNLHDFIILHEGKTTMYHYVRQAGKVVTNLLNQQEQSQAHIDAYSSIHKTYALPETSKLYELPVKNLESIDEKFTKMAYAALGGKRIKINNLTTLALFLEENGDQLIPTKNHYITSEKESEIFKRWLIHYHA